MRVANLYDDIRRVGRNDGCSLYSTLALRELGHEVLHLIPDPKRLSGVGSFDLSLWCDWGADALKGVLDYEPLLYLTSEYRACWLSDTHLGYENRLEIAKQFQGSKAFAFCMQKRAVEEFKRDGVEAIWLPHAFEPLAYPKRNMVKKYDVCFVGHINSTKRLDFLDSMFKEFPNFWFGQALFEAAAEKFSQSKVVLNPPIKDDLNMRVFETLGTGSFLLTEDIPSIHDFFDDGKHLVLYKTLDEAIEKAKYYIEHDDEREKIAKAGYEEVIDKHTYKHRIQAMLSAMGIQKEKELCLR